MSGDGADLDASKEALGQIAQGITQTLAELKELGLVGTASMGRGFSGLALSGMETGHEGLTSTLDTFCGRWEWGVRSLVQEGNAFAAKVGLSAGALHEQDQYIQGSFKVVANAGLGNPYASEADVVGKDWGEVLSENPYTQIRDADYSRESYDWASENSGEAWKGTIRDLNGSDLLLSNQLIDVAGLRDEADRAVDDIAGPGPGPQPGGEH
ncbi:hypothetical protein ACE1OC_23210 [Streptomyces sp. DSM 116496]|uniref:hypothetical protein n=1 Tax=Streptomyces stoeckheimensis TaxID=3344656 RepID=UPI0038B23504